MKKPMDANEQAFMVSVLAGQVKSWTYVYILRRGQGKPGKREKKAVQHRIALLRAQLDVLEEEINR